MPCEDDSLAGYDAQFDSSLPLVDKGEVRTSTNFELAKRANLNARIACEAIRYLEQWVFNNRLPSIPNEPFSQELIRWWKEHKAFDEQYGG